MTAIAIMQIMATNGIIITAASNFPSAEKKAVLAIANTVANASTGSSERDVIVEVSSIIGAGVTRVCLIPGATAPPLRCAVNGRAGCGRKSRHGYCSQGTPHRAAGHKKNVVVLHHRVGILRGNDPFQVDRDFFPASWSCTYESYGTSCGRVIDAPRQRDCLQNGELPVMIQRKPARACHVAQYVNDPGSFDKDCVTGQNLRIVFRLRSRASGDFYGLWLIGVTSVCNDDGRAGQRGEPFCQREIIE